MNKKIHLKQLENKKKIQLSKKKEKNQNFNVAMKHD